MQTISRRIAAFTLAGALILPTTTGVAQAQSSFGSSSAGNEYTNTPGGNTGNNGNLNFKADRIERLYEEAIKSTGRKTSPEAEARAEALLKQALNNELQYDANNLHYDHLDEEGKSKSYVFRIKVEYIDSILADIEAELDSTTEDDLGDEWGDPSYRFGIAAGANSEYVFLAITILEG